MNVAGIIVNLVPYHHARWEAFAQQSGQACHLVELTDGDAFKVLEFAAPSSYQRHTLLPGAAGNPVTAAGLRDRMAVKLDALQPDVVCVSGWALPVSLAALNWAACNRVPVVMLSESNAFDTPRLTVKEFIKRQVVGLSSAGLAGGTPQAEYLAKLGLARERIFQGYDAVDNIYFASQAAEASSQQSAIRKKHGLPEKYFLACARFGEKKNLPRLIEAFARYRELAGESAAWDLVIAGDGELRPEIETARARFGVGASVLLAGAKSYAEMPAYYGLAGAFVHASTTEQWGLVVNEAMASGLPVLVSERCGCAQDLVQPGVNGFTFDPHNVAQLAQRLLQISGRKFPLAEFGAASARIIASWGPERFAQGLQAAVEKATAIGPVQPTWWQRLILKTLLTR